MHNFDYFGKILLSRKRFSKNKVLEKRLYVSKKFKTTL
ncbi:hypothetical protein HMPREF1043_0258 [Streptococcus anginosus subsp. whileyi CCUG 39159]|uniref:Uncharacterized protein n=3 Tax=Streptococcus anginosus group TaxID=671232 RepID=I0SIF3_STRAP|nr:hypothetical protein HMPREF1042_2117 [Streptococcus constellatus subsp. pharyngis SK1060 = CCUG 46377]EID19087.1 hypothetical protein HMPREF1044_0866 [Streptococcus constellatus subsp. constellatus SK53]EID23156.1 hypothetical protein HMPREF1043_0258 [Streptococcus anginosus subsp. whileyi CCUG 39159]EUB23757.1 hypothetical protein HMPREF1514_1324 [Streptococcus sp. AS20]KXU01004.1 hypothetical protein SCODD09_01805 [Streptococcus constellatus]BBD23432.1 hypothetical protein SCSC_1790 [Stre